MGSYVINFTNAANETGSITADKGFSYTDNLNEINEANIKISSLGLVKQGLIVMGSIVEIQRNETMEFYGIVDSIQSLEGGGFIIHSTAYEFWLAKENGAYANSPYSATASAIIASEIIAESNYFTAGTVQAGANIDFRADTQQSLWNSLTKVIKQTDQDIQIDYVNLEVDILNHRGSSSSVATYNSGINIRNVVFQTTYPIGNKVIVYGKGDGSNQIISDSSSHGFDTASQDAYGVITKPVYDSSTMSQTAANKLADALVPQWKDPTKIYDFSFINPNESVTTGDIITLNARDQGLNNEEVRIVGMERGITGGGNEFLMAQVSNPAYKTLARKRNTILADMAKEQRDSSVFMQGATNLWGDTQFSNADAAVPLTLQFYIPPNVNDEAGNTRLNDVKLSYKSGSYKNVIGSITGSTGNSISNADYTNVATTSNADYTNVNFGSGDQGYNYGPYENYEGAAGTEDLIGDNNWRPVNWAVNTSNVPFLFHAVSGLINLAHSAGASYFYDIKLRVYNATDGTYYPSSSGVQLVTGYQCAANQSITFPFYIHIPLNWTNKNYYLQYLIEGEVNWSGGHANQLMYSYFGSRGHTHPNTFVDNDHTNPNTLVDNNHANPAAGGSLATGYDLTETGSSTSDTIIKIYNSANDLLWDSGARGETEETDVDISSYLTANDYYRVEIYPNSDAYVYGTVYVKGGIDS